jgi:hypothetical protein
MKNFDSYKLGKDIKFSMFLFGVTGVLLILGVIVMFWVPREYLGLVSKILGTDLIVFICSLYYARIMLYEVDRDSAGDLVVRKEYLED